MNRLWWIAALPALSAGAIGFGNPTERPATTVQYRCAEGRVVIATEGSSFVNLMVGGKTYELKWNSLSTAQGHGLEWRVTAGRASLTRVSSGYELASNCLASTKAF